MELSKDNILRARDIILNLANGKEPYSGEPFKSKDFLSDPKIIRCFFFVADVLQEASHGGIGHQPAPQNYVIAKEDLAKVVMPEGNLGANAFCKAVNEVIDPYKSKKVTGAVLNKHLKNLGILGEEKTEKGSRTVTNENSAEFGLIMEKREFEGREYEQVMITDKGKKYLLENLIHILNN
ncbi:MAG: hypothetical protein Q7J16_11705 [Candidatus Cloacimonadales bacterium]|nr:hypothetical protein [Candidatus Cloacimonadales bacterium]